MMVRILILFGSFAFLCSCTRRLPRQTEQIRYQLGDERIRIYRINSGTTGESGRIFFNMHENEKTSVKAARRFLRKHPGTLYYLRHGKGRNIEFRLPSGKKITVDPNRIFTHEGIRLTMESFDHYDPEAHEMIEKFSDFLIRALDLESRDIVIAIHNNTEDNYGLNSYLSDSIYAGEASEVFYRPSSDPDDFYFVTDTTLYRELKSAEENSVLQDNASVTDDGSLSVRCAMMNLPYVNVEAQHKHKEEQLRMYQVLNEMLNNSGVGDDSP